MKGSRHNLAVEKHQPSSGIYSSHIPCPFDTRSICQRQVEQLGAQLPIVCAWIVYQDPNQGSCQSVVHYTQKEVNSYPTLSYLEIEDRFTESLPVKTLFEVEAVGSLKAMVCLLDQYRSEPEY